MSGVEVYTKQQVDALLAALPSGGTGGVAPSFYRRHHTSHTDLFRTYTEMTETRLRFEVTTAGVAELSANVELHHRGLVSAAVGYGMRIRVRTSATEAGLASATALDVPHAYAAGNIYDETDHYGTATIPALPIALAVGWHEFSLWGNSHSSAAPSTDGLIEVHQPDSSRDYNFLACKFTPGATLNLS
ncbi:hypothetical protein [Pyruvatibacter mobilis]|uniref:hypothetical protein n=1 Tax=Pyruvatibacter mobilis TaxID=1712261 RepID=UPI003BB1C6F9